MMVLQLLAVVVALVVLELLDQEEKVVLVPVQILLGQITQ
jgi:hypothetical protein